MSLLAHLIVGQDRAEEPAATLALAYILNSSPDVARALVAVLGQAGVGFEPGRIESELEYGESRPDVTIRDSAGRVRIFVENKFWAGLTEAQPVSYLRELPEDPPSALLFIVPEPRVPTVWRELKDRCAQASPPLDLGDESPMGNVTWIRVGGRTLLITSWKHILEALLDAAHIAVAATNGVHYLVTWNLRHIANAFMRARIEQACRDSGYAAPAICTPRELMEDDNGQDG